MKHLYFILTKRNDYAASFADLGWTDELGPDENGGTGRVLFGFAWPLLMSFLLSSVSVGLGHMHCISHIRTHLQRSVSLKQGGLAKSFKDIAQGS